MGTRIVQFGILPRGILAALTANGYAVDACGPSIPKLKEALQRPSTPDAIALAENSASRVVGILTPIRSIGKVPLILFQDASRTCDPSQFDLTVSAHAPLPTLLERVAALIDRSRTLRAETRLSRERFHSLLREAASLCEQSVRAGVESQHIRRKFKGFGPERVSIPSVLVVDDYARWRDTMCSMLKDYADCRLVCEAGDGMEAVERAAELKPRLILLDLDLPGLNGIEAARRITLLTPDL